MKRFYKHLVLFPLILVSILISSVFIISTLVKNRNFKVNETDSNTLIMSQNKHYDMILSGASHARNLSRYMNHSRIENILGKSITNIAQGANTCGVEEQFFYLKYFHIQNNSVDQLVYLLSPALLFSETLPVASNTFNLEYFNCKFLSSYLDYDYGENKRQRIFEYIKSKLSWNWIGLRPKRDKAMGDVLKKVDMEAVEEGIRMYYIVEESMERYVKSCYILEQEIKYALDHNTETIFILPPAVFGKWPGHDLMIKFVEEMEQKYGIRYYNFSEAIMEPQYYYDHHHLNTKGVVYFTEEFLKPALLNNGL